MLTPLPSQLLRLPPSLVLRWRVTSSGMPTSPAPVPRPDINWGSCTAFSTWPTLSACLISTNALSYPPWITAVQCGTLPQRPLFVSSSLFRGLLPDLLPSAGLLHLTNLFTHWIGPLYKPEGKNKRWWSAGASSQATLSYHTPFSPLTQILIQGAITPTLSSLLLPELPYINHLFLSAVLTYGIVYLTVLSVLSQPPHLSASLN